MPAWALWAIGAALLLGGEVLTVGFFLGLLAVAAVGAALAAAVGLNIAVQVIVFVVLAVVLIGAVRPVARRHVRTPASLRTGAAALVGTTAVVTERVDASGGRVRIGGEVWSARAWDERQVLEPGARVEVVEIKGATALVYE